MTARAAASASTRVGLAAPSAHLALGSNDFAHIDAGPTQIAMQACAVATGAFDTHANKSAEATQPGQEFLVTTWCGGELRGAQKPTSSTKRGNGVTILVRVNAADDLRIGM